MKNQGVDNILNILTNTFRKGAAGKITAKGLRGTVNLYNKALTKAITKALPSAIAKKAIAESAIDQVSNLFADFLKGFL